MNKLELFFVLIISLFTLFIPLMIYLIVRSGERCRKCGKKSLVPLSSPVARNAVTAMATKAQPVYVAAQSFRPKPLAVTPGFLYSMCRELGGLLRRYPLWCAAFALFLIAFIGWAYLQNENQAKTQPEVINHVATQEPEAIVKQRQHMQELAEASRQKEQSLLHTTPPKFRVFRARRNEIVSYVVAPETTDQQLKRLLWLFRGKVRSGNFKDIGITQPTAKQWDVYGYKSGMLVVFRGDKCANEPYVSLKGAEAGHLGACGYGEHDAAGYQWGINADPDKDSGDIRTKDSNLAVVFDYRDNWKPSGPTQIN
jgi:hypothetical protein